MVINGLPGKFYHKALVFYHGRGWILSEGYFKDIETARIHIAGVPENHILWPADAIAEGSVYIPSEEELNEA